MDLSVENFLSRVQKYDRKLTIRYCADIFFNTLYPCISGIFIHYSGCQWIHCHAPVMYKTHGLAAAFVH
jgi:hypothetical protein